MAIRYRKRQRLYLHYVPDGLCLRLCIQTSSDVSPRIWIVLMGEGVIGLRRLTRWRASQH